MTQRIQIGDLEIAKVLYDLIAEEIVPGTGIDVSDFFTQMQQVMEEFVPRNQALLKRRDELQAAIDAWHQERATRPFDEDEYTAFLKEIGYLLDEGEDFEIETSNVDEEIATLAGPQLVVPVMNARYALNAANARWGSLYDALYGTDVIPEDGGAGKRAADGSAYNPVRGARVIEYAANFLNEAVPLATGTHQDVTSYTVADKDLVITLADGRTTELAEPGQFVGYLGSEGDPSGVLLEHNGLHIEIQIDPDDNIGKDHKAGVKDILMEAAVSTIQDCEDSVAAVDADDKVVVYRNWLGLMKGDLAEEFKKGTETVRRTLNPDRVYKAAAGSELTLHGRSLLLVRNVGHLMTTDAILWSGKEIPEGIMDGMITSLAAVHDLKGSGKIRNSRAGSVYIVKPKMHGPEEVAFTVD
ncbi:MAG: malate synthase G, partial [Pseudomonadales bacterium]